MSSFACLLFVLLGPRAHAGVYVPAPSIFLEADAGDDACSISNWTPKGVLHGDEVADCSPASWAEATGGVPLDNGVPSGPWTFDLDGWEQAPYAGATGYALITDVYTVTTSSGLPADVRLRSAIHTEISGKNGARYEFVRLSLNADVEALLPDGSVRTLLQRPPYPPGGDNFLREDNGVYDDVFAVPFASIPSGSRIIVNTAYYYAAAFGGDDSLRRETRVRATLSMCAVQPTTTAIVADSGALEDCGTSGDLQLVRVEPVQSVRNPLALFGGKPTVIRAEIKSTFARPVTMTATFTIEQEPFDPYVYSEELTVPGNCPDPVVFYFPHPSSDAAPGSGKCGPHPSFDALPPDLPHSFTSFTLHGQLSSVAGESDPGNNTKDAPRTLTVKESLQGQMVLGIAYIKVECGSGAPCARDPASYGLLDDGTYFEAIRWGNSQTVAMYPTGPDAFFGQACITTSGSLCSIGGDDRICNAGRTSCLGMGADANHSYDVAKDREPLASRIIAMVPDDYFRYHQWEKPGSTEEGLELHLGEGAEMAFVKAAVQAGTSSEFPEVHDPTVAHELGHSFDLIDEPADSSPQPDGYWVGCTALLASATDCEALPLAIAGGRVPHTNLMTGSSGLEPPKRWLTNDDYQKVALKLQPGDPTPVMVITGFLTKDWTFSLDTIRPLPNGRPLQLGHSGEFSLVALDAHGNVLSQDVADVTFRVCTANDLAPNGVDCVDMEELPVQETIAYPFATTTLEYRHGTTVMLRIDPLSESLRWAVEHVEDAGFAKLPAQRRTALLKKISALESTLKQGDRKGALQQLTNDIEKNASDWLVDYVPRDDEDYTKAGVVRLIDDANTRLEYQLANP